MRKYITEYVEKNIKGLSIILMCLIAGIFIGIFAFQFLEQSIKNDIISAMKSTLDSTKQNNFEGINVIKNGIVSNSIITGIIYVSAITLVAPFIVCMLNVFKGFSIGIYVCTMINIFGLGKGLLCILLIVVIPSIMYIPSFIYLCINSINFHYAIIEENNKSSKIGLLIKESYMILIGFSVMFLAVILEQFLSNVVVSIYKSLS